MAEPYTHMKAVDHIVWGTLDGMEERMEELAPEANYLAGLIREKAGYEQRVREATSAGETDKVKFWEQHVKDVEVELARLGETAEPRAKTRK